MQNEYEFTRTGMLLGSEGMEKLKGCSVLVFGVGGVGSHCIDALARSGVGRLILVDNDTVSISNINRQSIAFHSTLGQYKTHVMKRRIADINPGAEVITFEAFVLPDNLEELINSIPGTIDYIIDAIDTVTAKLAIVTLAGQQDIPVIASMGTGNKLHPELFEITDISKTSVCPLCKVMRRELKKRDILHLDVLYSREQPLTPMTFGTMAETSRRSTPGSVAFVPPVAGLFIAGHVIRTLMGLS